MKQETTLLIEQMSLGILWRIVEREHTDTGYSRTGFHVIREDLDLPTARSKFRNMKHPVRLWNPWNASLRK